MDLFKFDGKYIRLKDIYGNTFEGRARHGGWEFLHHEYGGDEDGIFIDDYLVYKSQIDAIEEIVPHGTAELWTERLVLRRYRPDDWEQLYKYFGTDPEMYKYSGWNPYKTPEITKETIRRFIDSYCDEHSYSWVIDVDDVIVGTIGAYDYDGDRIEAGLSINPGWWGRGFASEALRKVLEYLTENEEIPCVTAWCASDNIGSYKAMEKAGMQLVSTEKAALTILDKTYDKLIYEYYKR